ncbi:MAG: hypothetical protein ACRD12_13320 [Acidimicrobiales bacterium]
MAEDQLDFVGKRQRRSGQAHRLGAMAAPVAAHGGAVVDVGRWPHPARWEFPPEGIAAKGLRALSGDPLIGSFAAAMLERGYPVEQELATLDIMRDLMSPATPARAPARW